MNSFSYMASFLLLTPKALLKNAIGCPLGERESCSNSCIKLLTEVWQGHGLFQFVKNMLSIIVPLKLLKLEELNKWLCNDSIMAHEFPIIARETQKRTLNSVVFVGTGRWRMTWVLVGYVETLSPDRYVPNTQVWFEQNCTCWTWPLIGVVAALKI